MTIQKSNDPQIKSGSSLNTTLDHAIIEVRNGDEWWWDHSDGRRCSRWSYDHDCYQAEGSRSIY